MQWNASAEELARQLAEDDHLDWGSVRQLVYAEDLAPLVYQLTRARGIIPPDLDRDLAMTYYATAAQNALRLTDLEQVLGLMTSAGVCVALLKGAALIETVYGNAAVRPMEDVDLLVRQESLPAAVEVLSGFCGVPPSSAGPIDAFVERDREVTFQKAGESNTLFDLHWQVLDSPYYPHMLFTNWIWESAIPLRVGSTAAMSPSPEAMLLHLCGHNLIDAGRKELLWLYDIACLISKCSTLDWDLLADKARLYGLVLPIQHAVSRIGGVWKNLIPLPAVEKVGTLAASRAEKAFYDWAASADRAEVRLVRVNLNSLPSWPERLRYMGGSIFPPLSYMQHRYKIRNPFWVWLTYPYRWLLSLYRAVLH